MTRDTLQCIAPFPVSIHTTNSQSILMTLIKYRHNQYLIFNVICKTCTVKRNKLTYSSEKLSAKISLLYT